jgi:rare lipoprotein A
MTRKAPLAWFALAALVGASGCATVVPPRRPGSAPQVDAASPGAVATAPAHVDSSTMAPSGRAPDERGLASYYSDKLAGRRTASGAPYDPKALTAAHRTLPFGTEVDVVRPGRGHVRVRVTDRGPFAGDRIIDLSRAAAEAIDMVRAGVVEVELFVVRAAGR